MSQKVNKIAEYFSGLDLIRLRKNYLLLEDNIHTRIDFISSFVMRYGALAGEACSVAYFANGDIKEGVLTLIAAEGARTIEYLDSRRKSTQLHNL